MAEGNRVLETNTARTLAALNATNEAILYATSPEELYAKVCEAAFSSGDFLAATIFLHDPDTEAHIPLHRGSQFLLDTQRLWHVVCHTGDAPRYALISSFESGPALERWVDRELP